MQDSAPPDDRRGDPQTVVLGEGPIERLALRFRQGEIDWPTVLQFAKKPAVSAAITLPYARAIARWAFETVADNTELARVLIELLRAATTNLGPDAEARRTRDSVDLSWLEVTSTTLLHSPNWSVYAQARRFGEALLQRARADGNQDLAFSTLQVLGAMHLDPLTADQPDQSAWEARWQAWYERGKRAAGAEAMPFPPPAEALRIALAYFQQAADQSEGVRRGHSLKAIVQTLDWLARVEGRDRKEEIADIAQQALALLDPVEHFLMTTFLLSAIAEAGRSISHELLRRLAHRPVEDVIEKAGAVDATVGVTNLVQLLRRFDPALALDLALRAEPAAIRSGNENLLVAHHTASINALADALCGEEIDNADGTSKAAERIIARAEAETWPPGRIAGALIRLAIGAGGRDEEAEGLVVLKAAEQVARPVFARYEHLLKELRTSLWAGAGVNAYNAGDAKSAGICYANATTFALDLELRAFALEQVDHLVDVATRGGQDLVLDMLIVMFSLGPRIEAELGAAGVEHLQRMALQLTAAEIATGSPNSMLLHFTWQVAKAMRFGRALATGAAQRLSADKTSASLLDKIAALRPDVPLSREGSGPGSRIDTELRLLTFVGAETPAPGTTALERLTNLQHRFDRRLDERLVHAAGLAAVAPFALDDVQAALDPRTVLVQLYLGLLGDGRVRLALGATRDEIFAHGVPEDRGLLVQLTEGDRVETGYSYALDAFTLRKELAAAAPHAAAVAGAAEGVARWVIGGLEPTLDALAAKGHDHLCVLPHGPLHYVPLHLLPVGDHLLGDHWTVTVLPSLELLRRARAQDAPRRSGIASFGVTFTTGNPYGLTELPDAADEANRVAARFGAEALVDDQVTERAVCEGLSRARYVHIATHGALNLDTPSFQYLVVTPERESDGILYAHELLVCDLRGLDLVTLSACETALGRIDRADNPRGLPAALLLAGAEAIVGTLWQIESDVARAFFVELYGALADGATRLEAYRRAQQEVRRRFPALNQWGAFYYLGVW